MKLKPSTKHKNLRRFFVFNKHETYQKRLKKIYNVSLLQIFTIKYVEMYVVTYDSHLFDEFNCWHHWIILNYVFSDLHRYISPALWVLIFSIGNLVIFSAKIHNVNSFLSVEKSGFLNIGFLKDCAIEEFNFNRPLEGYHFKLVKN